MSRKIAQGLAVVAALGALALISLGLLRPAQSIATVTPDQVGLEKGQAAPNFTVNAIDGKKVSLSDFRGKAVMLNFWYIDCPGCQVEIPELQQFYARQQEAHKDFVLLGVNILDTGPDINRYAGQHHLTYTLAPDANQRVAKLYSIRNAPTSYFLNRQGVIHSRIEGPVDRKQLEQIAAQLNV